MHGFSRLLVTDRVVQSIPAIQGDKIAEAQPLDWRWDDVFYKRAKDVLGKKSVRQKACDWETEQQSRCSVESVKVPEESQQVRSAPVAMELRGSRFWSLEVRESLASVCRSTIHCGAWRAGRCRTAVRCCLQRTLPDITRSQWCFHRIFRRRMSMVLVNTCFQPLDRGRDGKFRLR